MGITPHIFEKVCKVTIGANKNLRLDTTSKYTCDVGATYGFIAYTSSTSIPKVSVYDNELMTAKYEKKVAGGYLYKINAVYPGDTSIHVTSNGESSSFPVSINLQKITSDTPRSINLPSGKSYVYKLKVMGNKEPLLYTEVPAALSISSITKSGGYYYVTVTAKGTMKGGSFLIANFPSAQNKKYPVYVGYVNVPDPSASSAPAPKSDTTSNVTIPKGSSYTFKITNATLRLIDTGSCFKSELIKKDRYDSYYKITSIGTVGGSDQLLMEYGGETHFLCWVNVGDFPTAQIKSDTTHNFSVNQGNSYVFKLTSNSPNINFYSENNAIITTSIIKHIGNDYYCKIIANNFPGQSTKIYASISNSNTSPKTICTVTIQ
jgi:hypothetical protein